MTPIAPAGKASTKKGSADAVCVRATYIGPAFSDTISQAAPTFCMKVPISETTLAMSKLRKVGERSGRQRLVEAELPELLTPLVSLADSILMVLLSALRVSLAAPLAIGLPSPSRRRGRPRPVRAPRRARTV